MVSTDFALIDREIAEYFRLKKQDLLDSDFPPVGCPPEIWKSICDKVNEPVFKRYNYLKSKILRVLNYG